MTAKQNSYILEGLDKLEKYIVSQINVNGEMIPGSHITRYLGAYLDAELKLQRKHQDKTFNMTQHSCKAAMLNLLKVKALVNF